MARYYALALTTKYWKPGTDYINEVVGALKGKVADGDFVIVSEKAISTAENNIVDESAFNPSVNCKVSCHSVDADCMGLLSRCGLPLWAKAPSQNQELPC